MQSKLCKRDGDGAGVGVLTLPEDIILEVLLWLPAKDLRQSRCVCKGWRALISDPAFHAARRSRGRASPLMVAVFGSTPEFELRLMDDIGNVFRVFDVKAPALLAPTRLDLIFVDRMDLGAMIIDPASGHHFTIVGTEDPPPRHRWDMSTLTIVNDYSFGRAVRSGDYKVLRLRLIQTSSRFGHRRYSNSCEVGTIMDDGGSAEPTWRQRPWGPFDETSFSCEHKATVNGVLYFMLSKTYSPSHCSKLIAAFDLESEEWKPQRIEGPLLGLKNEEDKWRMQLSMRITLTELKGTLCVVHNVQDLAGSGGHHCNIWLLKDPNRSVWVKEYTIQMSERFSLFTKPLDVMIDGTLLLLNTFRKAGNNEKCHPYILQFYNSCTKAFTDVMEMAPGFNGRIAFYTGSLQS